VKTHTANGRREFLSPDHHTGRAVMTWTKPDFEVVEVTMEVTAYVARR